MWHCRETLAKKKNKIWNWFAKKLLPSCKDLKNTAELSQNTVKATRRNFPQDKPLQQELEISADGTAGRS